MKEKQAQFNFRWRVILLLSMMTAVSCLVIFRRYLIEGEPIAFIDIGSDTQELYLPQYAGLINQLRHGDFSLWNWRDGFGVNMFLFNLSNPFLIAVYVIGLAFGTEATFHAMIYVYVIEIYLAVLFCYLFLSLFHFSETGKAAAAYSYGFSGFMMVWAQHYQFGACAVLLPLFLMVLERFLRRKKTFSLSLALMTALVVMNSFYTGYMTLLTAIVYVVLRVWALGSASKGSFGRWFRKVLSSGLTMLLGVGLSGLTLIPSAMSVSNVSSRLDSNTYFANLSLGGRILQAFKTPLPKMYYKTLVFRLFSSTSMGIADGITDYHGYANYYEGPCLFFGTLFILIIFQYFFLLFRSSESGKRKAIEFLAMAICLVSFGYAAIGVMMDGFSGLVFRYAFLAMPYFALVMAKTLTWIIEEKRLSIAGFILGILLVCGGYFRIWQAGYDPKNNSHQLTLWGTGVLMAAVLFLASRRVSKRYVGRMLSGALIVLVTVNVVSDGRSNFAYRHTVAERPYLKTLYDTDTLKAIRTIKKSDPSFFRIEKMDSATKCMDSMAEDYAPVSSYNSTMNGNVLNYFQQRWPESEYEDPNHIKFSLGAGNREQTHLLGVRYVLLSEDEAGPPGYSFWKKVGHVTVLKSDEVESIASFYGRDSVTSDKVTGLEMGDFSRKISVRFYDRLKAPEASVSIRYPKNSGRVSVRVRASKDGILFMAIPFERGWTAFVDGKESPRMLANEGFTAVSVSSGTHTVQMVYRCPGLREGEILSAASLLALIIVSFVSAERLRKRSGRKTGGSHESHNAL